MRLTRIKTLSMSLGVYPHFRFLHDRLLYPGRAKELRQTMSLYSQFVSPGDLCFDIGANMGNKTEAMLRLGARVISVEANPDCVRELRARFKHNPSSTCVPKAAGSKPGRATFYVNPTSQLSSLRPDWADSRGTPIETEVTTLDQLIEEFGVPKFCKVDVEGAERDVLHGLSHPLKMISLEYHLSEEGLAESIDCLALLRRFGRISVNLSAGETFRLFSDQWRDVDSFVEFFRGDFRRVPDHFYGDLFVRDLGD